MTRLLIAIYLIEAGIVLILAPWMSTYWEHNRFADFVPALAALMANRYVRGAVSGVGLVTTIIGLRDLVILLFFRPRLPPAEPAPVDPPTP